MQQMRYAAILRWWIDDLRPLIIETCGIADSCYLFPGTATPRDLRAGLDLPAGCVSGAWFADLRRAEGWHAASAHPWYQRLGAANGSATAAFPAS